VQLMHLIKELSDIGGGPTRIAHTSAACVVKRSQGCAEHSVDVSRDAVSIHPVSPLRAGMPSPCKEFQMDICTEDRCASAALSPLVEVGFETRPSTLPLAVCAPITPCCHCRARSGGAAVGS
jgi:hypothetical protein